MRMHGKWKAEIDYFRQEVLCFGEKGMVIKMQNQVIDRRVEEILSGMTVEDKVGQLFIVRRPQDDGVAMDALRRYRLGGFTLYACDFENRTPESVRALLASYREAATVAPFIAADEEGGRVVGQASIRSSGLCRSPRRATCLPPEGMPP